jgi:2'-5' RNA ligase
MSRLFLGIPAVLDDYNALQEALSPFCEGRWIVPEQLHLTLLFIGDRMSETEVLSRLQTVNFTFTPSALQGVAMFERNRILHLRTQNPSLQFLYERINQTLELPKPKKLHPHVTLMRCKKVHHKKTFKERLAEYGSTVFGSLEPKVALYESTLHHDGARYRIVKEWVL